jgi:hypothetical protein
MTDFNAAVDFNSAGTDFNSGAGGSSPQAQTATAAAVAGAPTTQVSPSAGAATTTAVAQNASVTSGTNVAAGVATATGVANNAQVALQVTGGLVSATAVAQNATASTAVPAPWAPFTKSPVAAETVAPADLTAGGAKVVRNAGSVADADLVAAATKSLPGGNLWNQPTVVSDNADAATATATAVAQNVQANVAASAGVATATTLAQAATTSASPNVQSATATALAQGVKASIAVTPINKLQQWSNGYLLTDGTNWSGGAYDGTVTYNGHGTYKMPTGQADAYHSAVTIDRNRSYVATGAMKSDVAAGIMYYSLSYLDVDGGGIFPQFSYVPDPLSSTTLAAPVQNGDTTITLTSAANWDNGINNLVIVWEYTDSTGHKYAPNTYSRIAQEYPSGGITGNVVTLTSPWSLGSFPAGARVGNSRYAGTYKYWGIKTPTTSWDTATQVITGPQTSPSQWPDASLVPYAARSVRFLALNLSNPTGQLWIGEVELLESAPVTAVGAAQQPKASIHVNAATATATAIAQAATTSVSVNTEVASATAVANNATVTTPSSVSVASPAATGSAVAGSPNAAVSASAGVATAAGVAHPATITVASAATPTTATASAIAGQASVAVAFTTGSAVLNFTAQATTPVVGSTSLTTGSAGLTLTAQGVTVLLGGTVAVTGPASLVFGAQSPEVTLTFVTGTASFRFIALAAEPDNYEAWLITGSAFLYLDAQVVTGTVTIPPMGGGGTDPDGGGPWYQSGQGAEDPSRGYKRRTFSA